MNKRAFVIIFISLLLLAGIEPQAAEKVRFGTSLRESPLYALPVLAAEEKGFWKQNGLDTEWFPFSAGAAMTQAMAASSLDMALQSTISTLQAASRGVPSIVVADLQGREDFMVWVPAKSPFKGPKDLKGAKIGIIRFGSLGEAYTRTVLTSLGLQKEVRVVAAGGAPQLMAALKAGVVDGAVSSLLSMAPLKYKGELREIVSVRDFLPKEWSELALIAHKNSLATNPEVVRRVVKAVLEATDFVSKNRTWALEKMVSFSGFSPEASQELYHSQLLYSKDGKIERKSLETIRKFLLEHKLITEEKAAPLDQLYTKEFTG